MQTTTYRKTKTGQWVAYGPAATLQAAVRDGHKVRVTKRSGDVDEVTLTGLGKPFFANGQQVVYGYIASRATKPAATTTAGRSEMCAECGERPATTTARDLSGIVAGVCWSCKRNEGELSFC